MVSAVIPRAVQTARFRTALAGSHYCAACVESQVSTAGLANPTAAQRYRALCLLWATVDQDGSVTSLVDTGQDQIEFAKQKFKRPENSRDQEPG
jgi:hypothetical protein